MSLGVPPELRTARDFIRWAVSRFEEAGVVYGHGTDNAVDEAVALVLPLLHLPYGVPDALLDGALTAEERVRLAEAVDRRVRERVPVAYLTRQAWFAGHRFYVDERVLVPRSPVAELIERGFSPWLDEVEVRRALDLCTGSGCIAVALAHAFPEAEVDATELSREALEVARINVREHGLEGRVRLHEGDLFEPLPAQARYELIVANPPYVDAAAMAALPPEHRHEPALGLAAGEDGLDCVVRILAGASGRLAPGGILVVEVGAGAAALERLFPGVPFLWPAFERGGEGVFLLRAAEVAEHAEAFAAEARRRAGMERS
ncbi:50S ribosomal protein L3 N(5)-glutamine methyltransferase [Inmirania thermothiophila]|uniref:Ribosomal protein uL3 glutamine methyltransferase n=1 Tax=Inmirania thermothiophila TaxID=1750597 RepID=A0A3N1Y8L9_9GAMM|nr:50S ribosomal protein L3 N(5)-glutamine methyltransferase [Inmirania thermothiophila]ROR35156.1 [LSU ribosomal protein L3P]-glutamine N5-methyltransferase [Inmirania thermothiophila]